ncbi:MAG: fatty acid desaturase [Luteimonas sp.]
MTSRLGLRNRRDLQSLAYMAVQPMLMGWQWMHGFDPALYALSLFLAVGISVIHHNHAHLPMWHGRVANDATDLLATLLQGHPTCVFRPTHNANHHRHRHGERDVMRTWRFGDHNHLFGWALHPLQAAWTVYPLAWRWMRRLACRRPRAFAACVLQYTLWLAVWSWLLWLDAGKALAFVIVPQLFGLHWLLAANYLQHAHADDRDRWGYARNFEGWINPLLFNIGLHTAHHEHGRAHWSELADLHRRYRDRIPAALLERGFLAYTVRVFLLAPFVRSLRSRSLRDAPPSPPPTASGY